MKIGNLKKIATVGLALGAINSTVAVNERALSNSVTPKVVDLENTLKVNEIKKDSNENEVVPECKWNDYVGTVLSRAAAAVVVPPTSLMLTGLEKMHEKGLIDPFSARIIGLAAIPTMAVGALFRVNGECVDLVDNYTNNVWNELFGVRI